MYSCINFRKNPTEKFRPARTKGTIFVVYILKGRIKQDNTQIFISNPLSLSYNNYTDVVNRFQDESDGMFNAIVNSKISHIKPKSK